MSIIIMWISKYAAKYKGGDLKKESVQGRTSPTHITILSGMNLKYKLTSF